MQLNKFTDYALRLLMYISRPKDTPYTIAEIAQDLHVSQNHLVKVVHFMSKQEWIMTSRGKGGGISLNPKSLELKLGNVVQILQGEHAIVECNTPPCVLRSHCGLKGILDQSLDKFYDNLNQYSLANVLTQPVSPSSNRNLSNISNLNL